MDEILERLARLETLMENHLDTHSTIVKFFLAPLVIGVVLLLLKAYVW